MTMPEMLDQAHGQSKSAKAFMAQAIATGLWENIHSVYVGIGLSLLVDRGKEANEAAARGDTARVAEIEAGIEEISVSIIEQCIQVGQMADAFHRIRRAAERYRDQTAPEQSESPNHLHVTTHPTQPMVV